MAPCIGKGVFLLFLRFLVVSASLVGFTSNYGGQTCSADETEGPVIDQGGAADLAPTVNDYFFNTAVLVSASTLSSVGRIDLFSPIPSAWSPAKQYRLATSSGLSPPQLV